jgi:hypothetical protein
VQDLVEGIRKTRRRERGKRRKENEETESRGDAEKSSP